VRPATPRGFRDVLPQEAAERASVSAAVLGVFDGWGYDPVETPVVETYAALELAGNDLTGTAFRLLDLDGSLLALRPDMTMPIARLAASRLDATAVPLRLCYDAEVFREHESLRGQPRQFTQLGIELLGASGPAADAEVVAVLAEALSATGLADFTIAIGTVAVLRAILEASGAPQTWREAVLAATHDRNLVALDALAAEAGLPPEVSRALREVPRIRGGADAIERCREHALACGCAPVLDDLALTWQLLQSVVERGRIIVDFGVMRSFDYYVGLVVEAYAPGVGVPLGGGGRYDGVLAGVGAPAHAAGFAIGLDRLMIALVEQGVSIRVSPEPRVVSGPAADAFARAAGLRAEGVRIALAPDSAPEGGAR
jgi:ATP phosphoribosyltransferase